MAMTIEMALILILIGGYLSSRAATAIGLPSVLGMTVFGILLSILTSWPPFPGFPPLLIELAPSLKSLALVIILLRAGLGIHVRTLKKVGRSAVLLSFLPMGFEALWITLLTRTIFSWGWSESMLLGFLISAVSPAVVVPSMLELKERRYGEKNDVPTMVLAGASLDDVFAITFFTMVLNNLTGAAAGAAGITGAAAVGAAAWGILLSVVLGVLPGLAAGAGLVLLFRRHHGSIRATEKLLLVLGLSIGMFSIGQSAHTAALLGVMTIGFVLLAKFPPAARELSAKLNKAWVFAEIMLFVLIGMAVDVDVALTAGPAGLLIIFSGLLWRSAGVFVSLIGSPLSRRERTFVALSYLPKATVQAALGAVPLAAGIAGGQQMLAIAVLSILVTAPLGLIAIRVFGSRLLDETIDGRQEPAV
jgi:NhaP-type Na+/H+ or K+/H+ antiporter